MLKLSLVLVSLLIGLPRVLGIKHIAYQAIAHLWVGGLLGAYLVNRRFLYLACVLGLSTLEVICFFYL